ncbi:ARL14 effector protein-like [Rhopilema esculentum]|uniref:ARL14 effector protein-like n=1 Tax=Rhopilema esculentum TaxID=499914 RepID=UPI0031D98AC1
MEAKCTFGLLLEDECHKHSYSRQTGLKSLSELSDDSCEVYLWRAGLLDKVDCKFEGTICLHHEYVFRTKYEEKEKKCCNLFKKHKKKAVGSLTLKLELAKQLKDKGISVVPGSKLCRNCDEMVISEEKTESREGKPLQPEDPDPTSKEEEDFELSSRERLETSFELAGVSPIKLHSLPKSRKVSVAKEKLQKQRKLLELMIGVDVLQMLSLQEPEISLKKEESDKAKNYDELLYNLKENIICSGYREKIQILTLAPDLWPRAKVVEFFGVSEYLFKTARSVKKEKGILAIPESKKGKKLPD